MVLLFDTTSRRPSTSIIKNGSVTSAIVKRNRNSAQSSRKLRCMIKFSLLELNTHTVSSVKSTDKKLTGKTSYADLEEEWGAQSLISLYIRDYDKKVFDDCMKLGNNRFVRSKQQNYSLPMCLNRANRTNTGFITPIFSTYKNWTYRTS